MKTKIYHLLALLPFMMFLAGCSDVESYLDDLGGKKMTLTASIPINDAVTRVGLSEVYHSKDLLAQWQDDDEIQLYVCQNEEAINIGKVKVYEITPDKKHAKFNFSIPSKINVNEPYVIYALCGIEGKLDKNGKGTWDVVCTAKLTRTTLEDFRAPMYCVIKNTGKTLPVSEFKHLGTYELLHVKNDTSQPIYFNHYGYVSETQWYQSTADVRLQGDGGLIVSEGNYNVDYGSGNVYVYAHDTRTIISWYIPNGYKMNCANLTSAVNNSNITSSNKKSSDVNIERAHAYHLYVTWDGKELKFDNGDITAEKIISIDPEAIDFGSVDLGKSERRTFVVSNTGNTDLTFYIESTHGVFDIAESGKDIVLHAGEDKPIDVVFTPSEKDTPYSLVVNISSDAMNGTQSLSLSGRSNKVANKSISVEPSQIDFGVVETGSSKLDSFVVRNTGDDALTFMIESTNNEFTISESGTSHVLASGMSKKFIVTFKPNEADTSFEHLVSIYSDADNGTQYIRFFGSSVESRIDQVIPDDIRDQMEPYINIYDGTNPPNIEGDYLLSPAMLYYDSKSGVGIERGFQFEDHFIKITNQDMVKNTLDYDSKTGNSTSIGKGAFISGEGDKFSVFFNIETTTNYSGNDIYSKQALVISGIKTDSGIKDLEFAFVMVDKRNDYYGELMGIGDFRVVIDGDYMSYYTPWSYVKRKEPLRNKTGAGLPMILQKLKIKH